jgi:hypothetical protein
MFMDTVSHSYHGLLHVILVQVAFVLYGLMESMQEVQQSYDTILNSEGDACCDLVLLLGQWLGAGQQVQRGST